jgi:hypothetical protein
MTGRDSTDARAEEAFADRAAGIPALRTGLQHARSRWYARFMLNGVVWSALAGLLTLCGLELAALFDEAVLVGEASALAVAASVFALSGAAVGAVAIAIAPDDAALARLADQQFSLQERFGTGLETENARASGTFSSAELDTVRRALLADAERHGQRIDARRWFELDLPRAAWAVPVLAGAALLLSLLQPGALGRTAVPEEISRAGNPARFTSRSTDTAGDLQSIAAILAEDARKERDTFCA